MADFLAENNVCGQTILRLVARGNSIIAELLRLASFVPPVFRLETRAEQQKYQDVVLDFTYFKAPEGFKKKIEDSSSLQELDDEIRESHNAIVCRIYDAFESVQRYVSELISFVQELGEGVFIQRTLENTFSDEDGKQLLCEGLYLYGVMLLVVDTQFPGIVRERIIVAHHRHSGQTAPRDTNIDDVCKLMRCTGFSNAPGAKRPQNYPESFFKRVALPPHYVSMVIGHLRSDDIYHQVQAYPSPEHRSTALSTQAAMLYVCLFFASNILQSQTARMREIVDKYFSDNWVISIYMGMTTNLIDAWEPFKAAKQALNNTLETQNIREQATKTGAKINKLVRQTSQLLAEGTLTEVSILGHSNKLLNLLRECNVALRWSVLHMAPLIKTGGQNNKRAKVVRDQVFAELKCSPMILFNLLINTSALELSLQQIYRTLVEEKAQRWDVYRQKAKDQVQELSEVFSGNRPLARVTRNDKLQKWFLDIGEQIHALGLGDPTAAGRKIIQLIQALKQVKEFHGLESSAGVVQAVEEVVSHLQALVRVAGVSEDDLVTLALISDISYAWILIDEYTEIMQTAIKKDPSNVAKLRAAFLKLSSGLELPLLRINQARSPDLMSVSAYYSGELVTYVRKVLQIVPETMFSLLAKLILLQTEQLKEIPTRLDKDKMRDFAQLQERYQMAELSHSVAVLADGVAMMDVTLVGVIEINPKQLLEEGVRRELVVQVARTLHQGLTFNSKSKSSELFRRLDMVKQQMSGFHTSFEYIQDYINMYALKIWQEEMSRIVNFNVEQECNQLLRKKVPDHDSLYQSVAIPIPRFAPTDNQSVNFIGRLAREILRVTDPKNTVYVELLGAWYDSRTHTEVLTHSIMAKVESSISTAGLTGLDKLLAFLIVTELQNLVREIEVNCTKDANMKELLRTILPQLAPHTHIILQPTRQYNGWVQRCNRTCNSLLDPILRIGQMQILRYHASNRLNALCKFESKYLAEALDTMNRSLLGDVRTHYADPTKPYPDEDGTLTSELSSFLEWCGMTQPMDKIYVTTKPLPALSLVLLLVVVGQLSKMHYLQSLESLTSQKGTEGVDGPPLIIGLSTVLRQFHPDHTHRFIHLLSQYINSVAASSANHVGSRNGELPTEVLTALTVVKETAHHLALPQDSILQHIPHHLLAPQVLM
ncbi:WASH complex subunit strump [Oratosquilla oratoria]|uniref:WASH complex subunit strump n=1 Tax=Oratosquilla oratoria TaxID=337810 RepID=UPI003F76DBFE